MLYTDHTTSKKKTSQFKAIPGKKMVKNNAGGFVFEVDKWERLVRFLVLGSELGTYYASERTLVKENAANVIECVKENGVQTIATAMNISTTGRAPKNEPAMFVLALACTYGDEQTKRVAYAAIPEICRTGTHIFHFCKMIQDLRGWSRGLRKAVSNYYLKRDGARIAYDVVKYRQRDGWTHKDVIRLAHPKTKDQFQNAVLRWAVGKEIAAHDKAPIIEGFEKIQALDKKDVKGAVNLITTYRLPREAVPTEFLTSKQVWEALLQDMPVQAMIRNLGVMTSVGLLNHSFEDATKIVVERLGAEMIKKAMIHPLQILVAMKTYAQGRGMKGKLSWAPVDRIVNKLDDAFYTAFKNVHPTNKNTLLAVDVSGSMEGSMISGMPLSAREASMAMAMVTLNTEPNCEITAFSGGFVNLKINKKMRLDEVIRQTRGLPFDTTDCAIPMLWAIKHKVPVDTFVIYTDNETYAGRIHPKQALDQYRQVMGRDAKLAVVGMTATQFTIADYTDRGMMDVVGFDTSVPEILRLFSLGAIETQRKAA